LTQNRKGTTKRLIVGFDNSSVPPLPTDAFGFDVCLRLAKAKQSHEAHEIEEFDPDDVADDSLPVSDESLL
jgi:hypothetical protein